MQKTTLFKNGGSQAVRLPKDFRLEGTEVYIKKVSEGILLIPKEKHVAIIWQEWADNLAQFDEPLEIERGGSPQERDKLDEIFP
jgi:antitoxin VapB